MDAREVDVVVIGLGPGGESLAGRLAQAGLEVLAVDRRLVGGECPYYGCIPSKMMVRAAHALAEARRVDGLAGSATVTPDWTPVHARIRDEATTDWDDTIAVERLQKAGATVVHAEARLTGSRTVDVDGTTYTARTGIVLNTGTEPQAPDVPGLDGTPYWTNRDALRADAAPESLAVVGGGPIGAELAQAFSRFGTRVTVLQRSGRLLPADEPEAGRLVADVFGREGIQVLTDVEVTSVAYADGTFEVGAGDQTVRAEKLLVAAGRRPNLAGLGLDSVGLDPDSRVVEIDGRMRALGADGAGLWAIGDITGKGAFTHVSMYQAGIAARDILGEGGPDAEYHGLPHVTFTDPEVAAVGMTEQRARDAGLSVAVGLTDLGASTRGWIAKAEGLVKVVADTDRGVLVGGTVVGPAGGEVLGLLLTAVHAEVPVERLRSMIYAYPTLHRAIESAVAELG